jgi:replicative DNA helicase
MASETTSEPGKVARLREDDGDVRYREPPRNYEAEQALLGAILVNNKAFEQVADFLVAEDFAEAAHGRVYEAVRILIERGQIATPVTLKAYFEQDEGLAEIGGAAYLARLAGAAVSIINAAEYGRLVHDLALRRNLIALGEDVVNEAFRHDIDLDAMGQIEIAEKRLYDLATTGQYEGGFLSFETALTHAIEMAEAAYAREGSLTGVATGFADLDKLLGGLHRSDLLILAGRPAMGKTALATNIAFHAAKRRADIARETGQDIASIEDGAVIGFFSLEMSAEQLATRILAEQAQVSSEKIRRGELSHDDFARVVQASQDLARVPLYIDDTPALTVAGLRTRARRLKRQRGLGLIVVDYLQLVNASARNREANRVQEISEISRGLKTLAKELDVPVVALSQLSRAVEQREDKRPQLSDLRESGSIEQDADVVMFIFREEYYLQKAEPVQRAEEDDTKYLDRMQKWQERCEAVYGLAEVIVAKQRHGPTGTVKLRFEGATTRFSDYVDDARLPEQFE